LNLAGDPPETRAQSIRRLKAALKRDLEWLLNTRKNPDDIPESLKEVYNSVFNFGLPDFSHISMSSVRDRNRLLRSMETVLKIFEPRLGDVKVSLVDAPSAANRSMRFLIDGMLKMDPAPEQVSFDTVLELTTSEYSVKGEGSAR